MTPTRRTYLAGVLMVLAVLGARRGRRHRRGVHAGDRRGAARVLVWLRIRRIKERCCASCRDFSMAWCG
jgi:hypothetical protein